MRRCLFYKHQAEKKRQKIINSKASAQNNWYTILLLSCAYYWIGVNADFYSITSIFKPIMI